MALVKIPYFRERSEPSGRETLTFRLGQCEICGNTPLYTLRSSFLWMERLLVQRKRFHPQKKTPARQFKGSPAGIFQALTHLSTNI